MNPELSELTPYASTRDHVLDEVGMLRARAIHISSAGGGLPAEEVGPIPTQVEARVRLSLAAGIDLRLPAIESTFGLTAAERLVLVATLAAEIDPLFRGICRGLQGELAGPTLQVGTIVELVTDRLATAVDAAMLFLPEARLRQCALISVEDPQFPRELPLQALRVKIDRNVALYLLGERDASAPEWLKVVSPAATLERARLSPERKTELVAYLTAALTENRPTLVEISGPPGAGRKFLAEGLCVALGRKMVAADCRLVAEEPANLGARLAELRRETLLAGAIPYLDHYQSLLTRHELARGLDESGGGQTVAPAPTLSMPAPLDEMLSHGGLCFLGTEERYEPLEKAAEVLRITLPFPSPRQRAAIWEQTFEALGAEVGPDIDLVEIGRKLALDAGRIQAAARAAISQARLAALSTEDRGSAPLVMRADLMEASRHQLQHDLKSLAVRVDKAYRWEDLVISVDGYHSLLEMISYAANAEQVYERWGFGAKHSVAHGISALFSGPPGTGKTMCASVIARELDMELFRVDLSRVVSKWIGETEKNLARVFDEADRSHAVVLFDEADSLFAKRTEVKSSVDRYANLEVNFLLQRMESFNGITVLTTNFEDTIDSAFKRRLTFRIRFEKPDASARAALWEKMFPASAEVANDVDFAELGRRFEISGGNIRNAAIRSAFLAASEGHAIDMETLVKATFREAREMGVLIAEPSAELPPADESATGSDAEDSPPEPHPRDPSSPPPRLV
ncbi:MAG TPA: AAA family ATPase, partial [Polyangia bacterium]